MTRFSTSQKVLEILARKQGLGDNSAMSLPGNNPSTQDAPINSVVLTAPPNSNDLPTLVLLHGWGRSLEALRPMAELLSTKRKVILIDLPGFGLSPLPHGASNDGGGWGTLEYSERVMRFLDQSGVSSAIIVGHSFGGRISLHLASQYPALIKGLVLIGSHGLKRKRAPIEAVRLKSISLAAKLAKKIDGAFGTRVFAHYFAPRFGSTDYKAAGDLRRTLVQTVNEDLSEKTATIKAPTLLLWGENDTETPLDLAHSFRTLIKDSELHIFPNKGHEPFSDVGAHLMATYIENFIHQRGL